jgi:probable rRNA maturation factor
MIEIINRQRKRKLNAKHYREFTAEILRAIKREASDVSIVFVSNAAIRKLNKQFRGKDYVTDVLSFPTEFEQFENETGLGEIVIATDRAAAQAKENGLTLQNEIKQLILHGLLHLCGYDHESDNGEMNRLELKLRKKLGIQDCG